MSGRLTLVALAAVAVTYAWPQQGPGWEENSHYLGARALASGRSYVDPDRRRIGDLGTGDLALRDGHYYMDKAPGLAFTVAPLYTVLRASGMRTDGDPTQMLWALGLLGTALPAVLLCWLVRRRADEVGPGYGTAAAVVLGLGTLLLPFATLFFSHALSAFLGFAAFTIAWRWRHADPRLPLAAAAGLIAGLAVTTEYPNALLALVVGAYVVTAHDRLRAVLAYVAGLGTALLPLAVYNTWLFGSPFHLSYEKSQSGKVGMSQGFFGVSLPSLRTLLEMLFSQHGLLVLSPVLAAGAAGLVLLHREGRRAETWAIVAILALYVTYAAGYFNPFGGLWPGPRYLVLILPFLAVPLAATFRRYPLATTALALISIANMVALTATHAHAAYHSRWFARILEREFPTTALASVGITGWYSIAPFFFAAFAAVVAAALTLPRLSVTRRDVVVALGAVAAWALLALPAPRRAELGGPGHDFDAYWQVAVLAAVLAAVALAALVSGRTARSLPTAR